MDISMYKTAGDYLKDIGKKYKELNSEEKKVYNKVLGFRYRERTPDIHVKESNYYNSNRERALARGRTNYQRHKAKGVTQTWFRVQKSRTGEVGTFKDVVGCTPEELTEHLKLLFTEGMTWDNWGKHGGGKKVWQIDHIKGIKDGGTTHYTNLQPLWFIDNLKKK